MGIKRDGGVRNNGTKCIQNYDINFDPNLEKDPGAI
jgi:hypothetical protein